MALAEFHLAESSLADDEPSDLDPIGRALIGASLVRGLDDAVVVAGAAAGNRNDFTFDFPRQIMVRPAPTLMSSLIFEHDDGQVIAADPLGAAYGCGATADEAAAEWEDLAREHYVELMAERSRLHPRMLEQLRYLQRIFG